MEVKEILTKTKTIAIVGLSPNEERPSNRVAKYLQSVGYKIIPVNPGHKEILGERCFRSLSEIPVGIDLVDVFRRSEDLPPIIEEAIKTGVRVIWLQEGISVSEELARKVKDSGILLVEDRCIMKEHKRFFAL